MGNIQTHWISLSLSSSGKPLYIYVNKIKSMWKKVNFTELADIGDKGKIYSNFCTNLASAAPVPAVTWLHGTQLCVCSILLSTQTE